MRKLKIGSGKYKGKPPLKFFNYGKIGHFDTKCPYGETSGDEQRSSGRSFNKDKEKKVYQKGRRSYQK